MTALATTQQIRALQTARRAAGIGDDAWHDRLSARHGVESTKKLTVHQARAELDALNDLAPDRRPDGRMKLTGPYAGKLQALWIAAWNLGIVRERDDAALIAFVKRQTGIEHVRWVRDAEDAAKAIEALKGWMAREACIDWSVGEYDSDLSRLPQFKIVSAQRAIIGKTRAVPPLRDMVAAIVPQAFAGKVKGEAVDLTSAQWVLVMNTLGVEIRKAKGA